MSVRSPSWATCWPAEAERLRREIVLKELEATFVVCDPVRAAKLRMEARRLTIELEQLKQAAMADEVSAA